MAIRIRKHGTVTASFATAQQVDISHLNDSIALGDGTNLLTWIDVTGTKCVPVKLYGGGGDASASNQTSGAQKTQIVDDSGTNTVDATAIGGGVYALKVDVVSSVGGGAAPSATDGAAYVAGTSQFTPIGAARDDASIGTMAEDKYGILRMTTQRGLHVNLRDAAGAEIATLPVSIASVVHIDDNAGSLTVDGTVAITNANLDVALSTLATKTSNDAMQTSLALIDDVVFVDDAAFTAATSKVWMIGGQYQSAPNTLDDGDAGSILLDTNHAVQAVLRAGSAAIGKLAANSGVDIGDVDVTSVTCAAANAKVDVGLINAVVPLMGAGNTGTGSLRVTVATDQAVIPISDNAGSLTVDQGTAANLNAQVVGNVAHDGAASGNPVVIAGRAKNTNPTSVADGDVSYFNTDLAGRQIVAMSDRALVVRSATITLTNTTETTIIAAGGAGVFHDLTMLVISNTSATAVRVDIRDATAGTIQFAVAIAANGGAVIPFDTCPLNQTTAANNWTAQLSGSVTDIRILAVAIKKVA